MLAYLFVLLALAFKLNFVPHALGLSLVAASLLFFGARGPRRMAWLPVVLFAVADVYLTKHVYGYPLTADHVVTWAWYGVAIALGMMLRRDAKPARIGAAVLARSVSFFVVSNFAVWVVWRDMYPKTLQGLLDCYIAAVPFYRTELMGDVLFTAAMFGSAALILSFEKEHAGEHSAA
jgi:hypothetical protein